MRPRPAWLLLALAAACAGCHRGDPGGSHVPPAPAVAGGSASSGSPDAAGVLRQMLETYRGMRSYSERASKTLTERKGSQKKETSLDQQFVYQAPNRFLLHVQRARTSMTIASDGQHVQLYSPTQNVLQTTPAPVSLSTGDAFFDELRISLEYDALALFVRSDIADGSPTGLATDTLDGRPVYRLQVTEPPGEEVTLWIGRDDHLLYRSQQRPLGSNPAEPAARELEETHHDMRVNPPLPPDTFRISAPPGTKLQTLSTIGGKPCPPVRGSDLSGKPIDVAAMKGKVVVLNFWAHW
jgi:outer membrane lipoprotein-sorting protein